MRPLPGAPFRWIAAIGLCLSCAGNTPPPTLQAPLPPAFEEESAPEPPGVDRSKLPEPAAPRAWTPPLPEVFRLENQIRVFFIEQRTVPLVSLLMIVPRGSATDPVGEAGLTTLTADLLDEGAGELNALELSENLQRLGTDYSASVDVDYTLLSMQLLTENFAASAKLLADIVRRPRLDKSEFKRRRDQLVAQALANESKPDSARRVLVYKALFQTGYAGSISDGTRSTLKKLAYKDVKQHYKRLIAPDGVELIVVGAISKAALQQGLEDAFGDWHGRSKVEPRKLSEQPVGKAIHIANFPGAAQSSLALIRRAPGADDPDYFAAQVYNRSFGGAFMSRLNLNLREDKGYTYGAASFFKRFKRAGYFGLFADVQSDKTRASLDEMLKELRDSCKKRPLTEQERDESVSGLLLGFPGKFERMSQVAMSFASLPIFDRPIDWYNKWPQRIKDVSLSDANSVAKKYCDPEAYAVVVAGDRKANESALGELGMPLIEYDAQGQRLP